MGSTHCMGISYLLSGLETVWSHHSGLEEAEHKSLTLTMMLFPNGPVEEGEFGSEVGVILKQRPQAPPVPLLAPYASSLTAAEYPLTFWPHAVGERCVQRVPRIDVRVGALLTGRLATAVCRERRLATGILYPAARRRPGGRTSRIGGLWSGHRLRFSRVPPIGRSY